MHNCSCITIFTAFMPISCSLTALCLAIALLMVMPSNVVAQNGEINLLRNINNQRSPSTDGLMAGITNSAEPVAIVIPVVELAAGYLRHDKKTIVNGWTTVAGLGVTAIISTGLKYSVNRVRPYITYPFINYYNRENTGSFPSGHTSFSFCTATALSLSFPRWYVIAPTYLWAASVGYSRLYLGEHYPTDVLAGVIVGSGSAWLAYKGNKWLQKRKARAHVAL